MHMTGIAKRLFNAGTLMAAISAPVSAHDGNHPLVFGARLNTAQEVPAVTGDATGLVGFKLNESQDTMLVYGAVKGFSSAVTKFHVHAAPRGVAGPVAMDILPLIKDKVIAATWTGFNKKDVRQFLRGAYYLNVHSADKPGGEMRGQIELEKDALFSARMGGDNEVPAVHTLASGIAVCRLSPDDSVLTLQAAVEGLGAAITAAHLHFGPKGANGAVAANLATGLSGNSINLNIRLSSLASPAAFLDSLRKGSLYVNVHTTANTGGEIRGQLTLESGIDFIANLKGLSEVPAVSTPAKGLAVFGLSDDDSTLSVNAIFEGLKDSITAAHLHSAAAGANGPVVVNLTEGISGNSVFGKVVIGKLTDANAFLDALVKGNVYLNVHTRAHASGEIRGQLLIPARRGAVFPISGRQEIPAVATLAIGAGIATLDQEGTNLRYDALVDGLGSAFKLGHFHKAAAESNGGVVLNLTPSFKNNSVNGVWTDRDATPFTPVLAEAFSGASLYLNIHTETHGGGEVRGQLADVTAPQAGTGLIFRRADGAAMPNRLRVSAEGASLRLQGQSGGSLVLSILDVTGRLHSRAGLAFGPDGYSQAVDLTRLDRGIYFLSWNEGRTLIRTSFLKP